MAVELRKLLISSQQFKSNSNEICLGARCYIVILYPGHFFPNKEKQKCYDYKKIFLSKFAISLSYSIRKDPF